MAYAWQPTDQLLRKNEQYNNNNTMATKIHIQCIVWCARVKHLDNFSYPHLNYMHRILCMRFK